MSRGRSRLGAFVRPLWACLLAAGCLNPRPEEDPSYVNGPPDDGEPTGIAGAAGGSAGPNGSAGAGGSGFGAGGSGGDMPEQPVDDELDAGADAGPDSGAPNTRLVGDADAPDAGSP